MRKALFLLILFFLAACRGGIDPPKNIPSGYTVAQGDRVALALPPGWTAVPVSPEDFVQLGKDLEQTNPILAARMDEMSEAIKDDTLRFWANHDTQPVTVNIAAESIPVFDTLENHAQANRTGLEKAGFQILDTGTVKINGKKAAYTRAQYMLAVDANSGRMTWVVIQYTMIDSGTAYSISFGTPDYLLGEFLPVFEDIVNTFHTVDD